MQRLHLTLAGRVQGVGYRAFIAMRARELGLRGWVRNLPDGGVELEAEGAPAALARLRDLAIEGPGAARVQRHEESWSDGPARHSRFEVRP